MINFWVGARAPQNLHWQRYSCVRDRSTKRQRGLAKSIPASKQTQDKLESLSLV